MDDMNNRKYDLIGIGYSVHCPLTKRFMGRVNAITKRDRIENVHHIDNDFLSFGHEFRFCGDRFMIEYYYYEFGYKASVYSCDESKIHDLRH